MGSKDSKDLRDQRLELYSDEVGGTFFNQFKKKLAWVSAFNKKTKGKPLMVAS